MGPSIIEEKMHSEHVKTLSFGAKKGAELNSIQRSQTITLVPNLSTNHSTLGLLIFFYF